MFGWTNADLFNKRIVLLCKHQTLNFPNFYDTATDKLMTFGKFQKKKKLVINVCINFRILIRL